jgi:hypothetical protein
VGRERIRALLTLSMGISVTGEWRVLESCPM